VVYGNTVVPFLLSWLVPLIGSFDQSGYYLSVYLGHVTVGR
jgi:hypothetical protein